MPQQKEKSCMGTLKPVSGSCTECTKETYQKCLEMSMGISIKLEIRD